MLDFFPISPIYGGVKKKHVILTGFPVCFAGACFGSVVLCFTAIPSDASSCGIKPDVYAVCNSKIYHNKLVCQKRVQLV